MSVKLLFSLGFLFAVQTQAQTYWFDSSCNTKVNGVADEFKEMAARASFRVANPQDINQRNVFQRLFMTATSHQPTYNEVQRVMGGIGSFTASSSRAAADVRIYCDDDNYGPNARWTLVPDIPNDPTPNSQRTLGKDQEWEDVNNHVRRTVRTEGCKQLNRNGVKDTIGETYCIHRPQAVVPPNENPNRCTVTLCDLTLTSNYKSLNDLPLVRDLSQLKTLDDFELLTSFVLLHEMTHTRTWKKKDDPNSGYGWIGIQRLTNQQALLNSDTYAFFGLVAKLADRKFRVSKVPNQAAAGRLVRDTTLPPKAKLKRGLSSLVSARYHPRALVNLLGFK